MAQIYISSTFSDLQKYREAVYHVLRQMRHDVVSMEDYTAGDQRPLAKCLDDVAACNIYIGIFAWRYGYIPQQDNPEDKSITELEYRQADRHGKPRLIFLLDPDAVWSPRDMDHYSGEGEQGQRIQRLRDELSKEHLRVFFTTPDELAKQVSVAVDRVQQEWIKAGLERQRQELDDTSERRNQKSGLRVVGQPVLDISQHFKGRTKEARRLGQLLAEPSCRVVSVIGRAGIGKTALVSRILADLEHNRWPHTDALIPVHGIMYLSTRTTGITLERLFLECALMLGGEREEQLRKVWASVHMTTTDKVERLLEALDEGLYVVLLDHLQDLLDNQRQIADPELRVFFDRSLAAPHGSRLLITSRDPLAFRLDLMPFDRHLPLVEGLSDSDGIALLREMDPNGQWGLRELSDEQLAYAVRRVHGVPRALQVLAGLVRDEWQRGLDEILENFFAQENVAEQLVREAYKRLDEDERHVLEALSVLARPVPQVAVEFVLAPFFPGLNAGGILRRLIPTYMVTVDRTRRTLSLNPIDQDYAYSELPEEGTWSRKALERRAAEYYGQLRAPRDKWRTLLDVEPQLLEFEHRTRAGDFDAAIEVLAGIDRDFLAWNGYIGRAREMYRQLAGKVRDKRSRMLLALGLGETTIFLGPLEEAITFLGEALAVARESGDTDAERLALGSRGEVQRRLGRLDAAIEDYERAVCLHYLGARPPDGFLLGLSLAYCYQGLVDKALETGNRLRELAESLGQQELHGMAHDALSLAYFALGDFPQAIEHARMAIAFYEATAARDPLGYVLNVLGMAHLGEGRADEAIYYFEQGRTHGHEDDNPRLEGFCLFNLARTHWHKGDMETALKMAETAASTFERMGCIELAAASLLAEALRAAQAGDKEAEARALLACARASAPTPDLYCPLGLIQAAAAIARSAEWAELAVEAETTRTHIESRLRRPATE